LVFIKAQITNIHTQTVKTTWQNNIKKQTSQTSA